VTPPVMSEAPESHATDAASPAVRVAIDAGPLYGHRTGVGVAAAGVIGALATRGDVELDPYLVSFRARPSAGHRRLPVPGIVASHVWARSQWPRFDRWAGDAQVIHGTNYVVPPTRLPAVVSVYDCWFLRQPDDAAPVVRRAGARLRRAIAAGAFVHASSDDTAEQVRQLFGTDRVETIPLGPPPAPPLLSSLAQPDVGSSLRGDPFVLAIGTEERRKSLPLLVAAFGSVAGDQSDVRLVLAGAEGDDSTAVGEAIDSLPVPARQRVLRIGAVDDPTKHWLLRRAAVLAYPSLDEGFGFPILEAQLAATPVVASNVGAVSEVGGDGVLLVDGRDPAAFAAALGRAITDGGLRLGLIEAGQRNVHRFDWGTTADRLVALYRELVAESAGA
jgi:glycosyltransferase involved in cell wall biosynthesis